jgi:hypothetical protein
MKFKTGITLFQLQINFFEVGFCAGLGNAQIPQINENLYGTRHKQIPAL